MKNLIRIYRWEAGLKQYELAGRVGCSSPYLSQVENFRTEPDDTFKEKVAEVLHTPREILFPENDFRTVGEWARGKLGDETTVEWAGKT